MAGRVGQHLGNYRLLRLLGQGGFADVYLGEHLHLNTQAAIKVLHTHLTSHDIEPLRTEARTIARLVHPHIVRILDFDVEEDLPFLVMDYAPNGTLRKVHPTGTPLPLASIISYVHEVAAALQYAHGQGVIHRDIKPENLLLAGNHEVLLSDFGLAIIAQSARSQQIQETAGTIAYMAPEQLQGHPSSASDQYALGVMVYEWLSGAQPFHGSFVEIASQHLSASPPSLRTQVPRLPPAIEDVVMKALAKDPQHRFASIQAFAMALEEAWRADAPGQTHLVFSSPGPAAAGYRTSSIVDLPVQPTPLIGREQEVMTVQQLLCREDVRLLTLTGPGGVGKTRLGVRVAAELPGRFTDGVFFVALAPLSDPALVIPTIAQTLGLRGAVDRPALEHLTTYLQNKHLLLLLDNFEQVVSAAPQVADLLTACPQLKLLVTSREILHVRTEHEFAVPPLALPAPLHSSGLPDLAMLSQSAAVALFIQRTQAVKPDFQMTNANARAIAEICARLDGLPLAIELAAARSKLLPPEALLRRLQHRLQILTSGARDVPARHQTLRNTIQWSYDLLSPQEQRLFRQLSVFVGGCSLQAGETVCAAPDDSDGTGQILDEMASLIDKSLLQQIEQEGDEPRLVMLETIREYALECLTTSGEMQAARHAHAAYYLALAEKAEPALFGAQQAMWLERLEQEHDNLRAALAWLLEQAEAMEDGQFARDAREMALRLGAAARRFWMIHGHYSEGRTFLERALAVGAAHPGDGRASLAGTRAMASVRAKALNAVAQLALNQSDHDQAETFAEESLALSREQGDSASIALSLYPLGQVAWLRGNFTAAGSLLKEALALFRIVGDKDRVAYSLYNLAELTVIQGAYDRAPALFEESLALFKEQGNKRGIALSLLQLSDALFNLQGDQTKIRSLLEEGLPLFKEVGDKDGIASCFFFSGRLALSHGDVFTARSQLEKSLTLYREMGDRHRIAQSLCALAKVAAIQGDHTTARALYEESLAIARVGHKLNIASGLEGLASMVALQGGPTWAARLWGAADALRDAMGAPMATVERPAYEQAMAAARLKLGEKVFAAAWAEGRNMSPEQALSAQRPSPDLPSTSPATYPGGLTAREVEVLRLLARGLSDKQIAQQLVISRRTVNAHLTSIYGKLQLSSRSAATRYAFEHHLM